MLKTAVAASQSFRLWRQSSLDSYVQQQKTLHGEYKLLVKLVILKLSPAISIPYKKTTKAFHIHPLCFFP